VLLRIVLVAVITIATAIGVVDGAAIGITAMNLVIGGKVIRIINLIIN
jgi:hypothetical protein